jgi:nucleoside-diphosphate-sugar epimerase
VQGGGVSQYRGAKVAITGGVGLTGSALARRLVALRIDVPLIDTMLPEGGGNFTNIAAFGDRVQVRTPDIRDGEGMCGLLAGKDFLFEPDKLRASRQARRRQSPRLVSARS